MGEAVEIDVVSSDRCRVVADVGGDDLRVVEVRCLCRGGTKLRRELAEAQVLTLPLDQAEGCGIPEAGRAAVAEQHLVALGQVEEVSEA